MQDTTPPGGAGRRRALLVGVRETRALHRVPGLAEEFPVLDYVKQDMDLMRSALER